VKVTPIAGYGRLTATATADPQLRTTHDDLPRSGRRLVYVVSGEATVGELETPVRPGDLIEVESGEAMMLRSATGFELLELQFYDEP
jgi:uncharacterized cupin superfamily protein